MATIPREEDKKIFKAIETAYETASAAFRRCADESGWLDATYALLEALRKPFANRERQNMIDVLKA